MIDRRSFLISGALHLLLILFLCVGLPSFEKKIPPSQVISVSIISAGELTQSPRPNKKSLKKNSYKKQTHRMKKVISKQKRGKSKDQAVSLALKSASLKKNKTEKLSSSSPKILEEKKSKDPFDSVLQSVQELEKDRSLDQKTKDPRAFETDLISNKISLSELDILRQQLQQCWLVPPNVMEDTDLTVETAIDVNIHGMVTSIKILNQREGQKFRSFQAAVQSVKQALKSPGCSPLKLPLDKHHQWKRCVLRFSPKGIG
jgi:superfamily II DNA helicase RecQ